MRVRPDPDELVPPEPAKRGFVRRWFGRLLKLGLLVGVLGLIALGVLYWYYVVAHPGDHLDRDHILSLISQESPVFYADGETRLGVFFAEEHRRYVPFDEIPEQFVQGLVAAEDQHFWDHPGFDVRGITRAFLHNLKAGRVVAGGSTLTQQTAKNIYGRQGRTYEAKLVELANGLRLERLYTKQDILEFYSNQFYVNGNGRGLPIAARFFFDKELSELGLVECAFLAGVVKSPNRYNPWVPGQERQERALASSRERVDYVVDRMLEDGYITVEEHAAAKTGEIPFSRGHFRYARSVVLDEVERELTRPSFQQLLARYGISDLGTSGIRVTTTLDAGTQEGAHYALRHHLSEVGTLLEAPELEALFGEAKELRPLDPDRVRPGLFHRGTLESVDPQARTAVVELGGVRGILDSDSNLRLATTRKRAADRNTWAKASRAEVTALLEQMQPFVGRSVLVSIREAPEGAEPVLDWELDPTLQGAVLVLDGGRVKAMVGGSRNADFNRATMARRQLGSTWKLLLFEAALQLRWMTTDELDNRRAVFPYQGTFYYPRPDHRGAPERVSMAWAAVKSENLASIWLLYHLLDQLNPEQFRQVAAQVDLVPRGGEERADFVLRVQEAGVIPTEAKLKEGLFEQARGDAQVDLVFDGREALAEALAALHYGLGFAEERARLLEDTSLPAAERGARVAALDRNLLRQEALAVRFREARRTLLDRMVAGEPATSDDLALFSVERATDAEPRLSFGERIPEGFEPLTASRLDRLLRGGLPPAEDAPKDTPDEPDAVDEMFAPDPAEHEPPSRERSTGLMGEAEVHSGAADDGGRSASLAYELTRLLDPERVILEGQLTPRMTGRLRQSIGEARVGLGESPDLYSLELLALCRDFRTLVGLRYLVALAERSGVRSEVQPVLSMPLGSSDITLLEAAQLYQVMLTGDTYRFFPDPLAADASLGDEEVPVEPEELAEPYDGRRSMDFPDTALISRIELADGRVVYQAAREALPVQSAELAADLGSMLRRVVSHGTGRRAEARVRATSDDPQRADELRGLDVRVPLFGKTGTTNSYKNSAFIGVVPGLPVGGDRLTWGHGAVVATYVGYDDNTEMTRGGIRIQGASGSLPVWIRASEAVAAGSDVGDRVDLADLAFAGGRILPVAWPAGSVAITVDLKTGLPVTALDPGEEGTTVLHRRGGERSFEPYRPTEDR
jgi:penicillin-binding protein 1A